MLNYRKKVYLDIATILDLRQGTLSRISQDFAVAATTSLEYFTREHDVFEAEGFGKLDTNMFKQVFELYKNEIRYLSMCTRIFKFIKQLLSKNIEVNAASGVSMEIILYINTHPFVFSEAEKAELHRLVSAFFDDEIKIEIDYLDPKHFTFVEADKDFIAVVMYDLVNWFNGNEAAYRNGAQLKMCPLYTPRLYHSELGENEVKWLEERNLDGFEYMQHVYSGLIDLTFLPISFFCVDLPSNPQDLTDLATPEVRN